MSAAISALGAIIGYLGAEVVQASVFDRLLWPERFHNYLDASTITKLMIFGSMGGPLHRAALETLDRLRDKGLYKGYKRGDMLGTAFFANKEKVGYYHRTAPTEKDRGVRKEVRNGFWVEVLNHVDRWRPCGNIGATIHDPTQPELGDLQAGRAMTRQEREAQQAKIRAMRPIFRLNLEFCTEEQRRIASSQQKSITISEQRMSLWTIISVIISEAASILFAIAAALWHRFDLTDDRPAVWYTGFVLIPLLLKLIALLFTVRRTKLQLPPRDEKAELQKDEKTSEPVETSEFFEVDHPTLGFILISMKGPISDATFQFFRHYGHPVRTSYADRAREIACIAMVYAIGLYFPAGLILLSWMNNATQYLWLSQQAYAVFAAHILRLAGLQAYGRTEERVAKNLLMGNTVYLSDDNGAVKATLEIEEVGSVKEGRDRVHDILNA